MTPKFQNGLEQRMPADVAEELRTLPLSALSLAGCATLRYYRPQHPK